MKLFPSNNHVAEKKFKNSYRNTKIVHVNYSKIHNVWQPIKDDQNTKKYENTTHNGVQSIETDPEPEPKQMLELIHKSIKNCDYIPHAQIVKWRHTKY